MGQGWWGQSMLLVPGAEQLLCFAPATAVRAVGRGRMLCLTGKMLFPGASECIRVAILIAAAGDDVCCRNWRVGVKRRKEEPELLLHHAPKAEPELASSSLTKLTPFGLLFSLKAADPL